LKSSHFCRICGREPGDIAILDSKHVSIAQDDVDMKSHESLQGSAIGRRTGYGCLATFGRSLASGNEEFGEDGVLALKVPVDGGTTHSSGRAEFFERDVGKSLLSEKASGSVEELDSPLRLSTTPNRLRH
jgi:hypothetical protein